METNISEIGEIVDRRLREVLYYVCVIAAPAWFSMSIYDYFYADELFSTFIPYRAIGVLFLVMMVFLTKKTSVKTSYLVSILFLIYCIISALMLIKTPEEFLNRYFANLTMMMLAVSYVLVYRLTEIIAFFATSIITLGLVLIFNPLDTRTILLEGGAMFLFICFVMIIVGVIKLQGVMKDARMEAEIAKTTEIMALNASLEESLQEKEVLLQEVHHRVKNNLQIIISILRLQNHTASSKSIHNVLNDSVNRIRSMASIHETLYFSKNFASIDMTVYLEELVNDLISTYKEFKDLDIEVISNLSSVHLTINQAIPCALLVNEIITNSLKYAFNGRDSGKIFLQINLEGDNVSFELGDDGVGFTPDFYSETSIGLQLIDSLINQLDGTLKVDGSEGTVYKMSFPIEKI